MDINDFVEKYSDGGELCSSCRHSNAFESGHICEVDPPEECPAAWEETPIGLLSLISNDNFDGACEWAENNIEGLSDYFETWAKHCGAPRSVFVGHTVKLLIKANI